jgi:hypothetical protein
MTVHYLSQVTWKQDIVINGANGVELINIRESQQNAFAKKTYEIIPQYKFTLLLYFTI